MNEAKQRLRVFAGPNGSGKSTIKQFMPSEWIQIYVNADDIETCFRNNSRLNLQPYEIYATQNDWENFCLNHGLVKKFQLKGIVSQCTVDENTLISGLAPNSYLPALVADFIRHRLLEVGKSFSFETVMSSEDKLDFLRSARRAGYRVYLYFIATNDPEINVDRVATRVAQGGHDVREDKIKSRYWRCLSLLPDAILLTDRAYIFDNSGSDFVSKPIAEITNGTELVLQGDSPAWFSAVLKKML